LKQVISALLGLSELTKEQMPDLSEAYYDAVKNAVYNVWCVGYKNQKADKPKG
jgi:hypothetical protein